ncbi:MAG: tRNA pseudouridine(54/55) synthase Pus10 [Candidatus Nanohaloarchaeota archaeon QJJ-7]|nr:tRNA pseudouridine(54/55) synthase Pus10 [Candidatus Nanohaloarchaeota archaeon QJJ-7]
MDSTGVQGKAEELVEEHELCDHCLGRQFARLGHGLENWERGLIVQEFLSGEEDLDEDSFVRENIPDKEPQRDSCELCEGLFSDLEHYVERVLNALERYDYDSFLIGTRPPSGVIHEEEELWEEAGLDWVEPLKGELNRLIGKRIEEETDTEVDFERADVNPVYDVGKDRVEVQVNSLLVHGSYSKYSREIPQTKWPCGNCRGSGCEECDWTGKQYQRSVEELIAEPFLEATRAVKSKFHGAGREDVDARCLAEREFVLEIEEPEERDIDLEELEEAINGNEEIEVYDLEFTEKDKVEEVKTKRSDKRYRALIELEEEVGDGKLDELEGLLGTVEQATPTRVEHRRADKTREREVKDVEWERKGPSTVELEVEAEAGTYIKELISGDKDKTEPSVAQLLDTGAECKELDVVWIED